MSGKRNDDTLAAVMYKAAIANWPDLTYKQFHDVLAVVAKQSPKSPGNLWTTQQVIDAVMGELTARLGPARHERRLKRKRAWYAAAFGIVVAAGAGIVALRQRSRKV